MHYSQLYTMITIVARHIMDIIGYSAYTISIASPYAMSVPVMCELTQLSFNKWCEYHCKA